MEDCTRRTVARGAAQDIGDEAAQDAAAQSACPRLRLAVASDIPRVFPEAGEQLASRVHHHHPPPEAPEEQHDILQGRAGRPEVGCRASAGRNVCVARLACARFATEQACAWSSLPLFRGLRFAAGAGSQRASVRSVLRTDCAATLLPERLDRGGPERRGGGDLVQTHCKTQYITLQTARYSSTAQRV